MKRRGFFGALAGLALAPFGVKATEPKPPPFGWRVKPITLDGVPIVSVPKMDSPVEVPWTRDGATWWVDSDDKEAQARLAKLGYVEVGFMRI